MDELEFCIKSLSYPLGMLLETLQRKGGEKVVVTGKELFLPPIPFAARCYLVARALYGSLDVVDAKRLADDMAYVENFAERILNSPLGERVRPYFESADELVEVRGRLNVDWLEFERRSESLRPLLEAVEKGEKPRELATLSVDDCLLLGYISGGRKERERTYALLGRTNREFREAVKSYFRALQG